MAKVNLKQTCGVCNTISLAPQVINPDYIYFQTHTKDVIPIPKRVTDDQGERPTTPVERQTQRALFISLLTDVMSGMRTQFPNNTFELKHRDILDRVSGELDKIEINIMLEPLDCAVDFQDNTDLLASKHIRLKCPICDTVFYEHED